MKNKKKEEKRTKEFAKRAVFAGIACGFTLISAWNGYHFYRVMFGIGMALLISVTFEIARFTCLFRYMKAGRRLGILTIVLYMITASVCAFSSINSFTAEVIRKNRSSEKDYRSEVFRIRQAYVKESQARLDIFDQDIRYLKNQVAKYPGRKYWERRLEQIVAERDKFLENREKFLNYSPEDPEAWIRVQAAKLSLAIREPSLESEEIQSIKEALHELWGLDEITAKKIMGIIVTSVVEISIILLAFLSTMRRKELPILDADKFGHPGLQQPLLQRLQDMFGEEQVSRFLTVNLKCYEEKGQLTYQRNMSKSQRPIRDYLKRCDPDTVRTVFDHFIQENQEVEHPAG